MSTALELECEGPVATLSLNRPPINALDELALDQLGKAFDQIDADPGTRVVIVASAIGGVFCTGGDLKYWPRAYPDYPNFVSRAGRLTFDRMERLKKPSIAVIDGRVIGDGLSLALACDLRVASHRSTFLLPEVDYGFIPGWGTVGRLTKIVGTAAATELLLVGEPVDAGHAHRIGLVNDVLSSDDVMNFAETLASRLAAKPPNAMQHAKAVLREGFPSNPSPETDCEARCFAAVWGGNEWERGINNLFGRPKVTGSGELHEQTGNFRRGP